MEKNLSNANEKNNNEANKTQFTGYLMKHNELLVLLFFSVTAPYPVTNFGICKI